jgi:adenosine kinase
MLWRDNFFLHLHVDDTIIMSVPTYALFCMGNPLLDMQVRNGEKLLEKYSLKANDAILAEEKHAPM